MAFSTLALKEMIIKSTVFIILIYLMSIKVTHGYLECPDKLIPCANKTHCINIEQVCVDYHDCVDEQGHSICNYCDTGKSNSIACVTHIESHPMYECLSPNQICDGEKDCVNNQDEYLCNIEKCKPDFWLCETGTCIEKNRLCDKKKDCPDGSDEGDFCHSYLCGPEKIHCPTGECIAKAKMCDGVSHCSDGYDEEDCPHLTSTTIKDSCSIPSNTFSCSTPITSICISNDRICDGYKDCPMGDDEYDCNNKCTSKSFCIENPDVTCIQHPAVNKLCRCVKPGYRLVTDSSKKNTQICQDFDECNDSLGKYCSFNCINSDGNFNCTCPLGFIVDKETKICRQINDLSKPNFLILFDNNIILYNILNNTDHYSLKSFNTIHIRNTHHFDYIKYDPYQMFVIYYDQNQHAILCKSSITLQTQILVSNITVHGFAYNANDKTLFIIENQSQTLRMYTPISCEISQQIKMHSWSFNNISNSIQSMEIDIYERQFIFATHYEFLVSNMSEPNSTKIVYSTDREIKRFIYDISFKRIFWTTIDKTNRRMFPVYTCDNQFKQCYDTSIILPIAWPFGFFNDGLFYTSLSLKSLDIFQLYGRDRLSDSFITSTKQNIRSFLFLDYQQTDLSNLCTNNSCKNELCLQVNSTEINCLSIDENLTSITLDNINSDLQNDIESLIDDDIYSQTANKRKISRYRPKNTILFSIIILGVLVTILAFFVKRCHKRINKKALENEQRQNDRCLAIDEPNLDEFNVIVDDRVSRKRVDYARDVLLENPCILLIGRRRDSI